MEKKEHRVMIGKELEKVKGQREKGSLKTRHKKLKFSRKPKSHENEALTPLIITPTWPQCMWCRHYSLNMERYPKSHV